MSTTRLQEVLICFGKGKQADIATAQAAAAMWRFSKLNAALINPRLATENDADEYGKGHEFPTATYKTAWDVGVTLEKYLGAEIGTLDPAIEKARAENDRVENRRRTLAGFEPLASVAARGLEVQRVNPMWGLLNFPSVELTRNTAHEVSVSLKFWGHEAHKLVDPENWDRLAALAPKAFLSADPKALAAQYRSVTRHAGYCHSWHLIEANIAVRTYQATVSPCAGNLQKAGLAYTEALVRVALDNIDMCEPDRKAPTVDVALSNCGYRFGPPTDAFRQLEEQL